jgi:hypothetical protein
MHLEVEPGAASRFLRKILAASAAKFLQGTAEQVHPREALRDMLLRRG